MELLKTNFKGSAFYYQNDDRYIGQRIALGKYEPYLTKLMLEQIEEGEVVVDVGANIGFDTILFAKKVGEKGKVYAFEPDEINFEILQKNIEANKLRNVTAVKVGLGALNKKLFLYTSKENYGDQRMFGDSKSQAKIQVEILSLDSYLKQINEKRRIKMVKIDTQGFEPEVIEGMKKTISKNLPIIFFEYWPWAYKQAGLNKKKMWEFLREQYGDINFIDEYIQVYYGIGDKNLDGKLGYSKEAAANLWVKKGKDMKFYWGSVKDFWVKKLIKRWMGRPAT